MASSVDTLVLDDGELDDVRATLDRIHAPYRYLRGSAIEGIELELPSRLLVATARRALALDHRWSHATDAGGQVPARIVVVTEDSNTLRSMLRNLGFDYLVRRPVHPTALRLLLLRALYRGPERRVAQRVPIGRTVSYRSGFRKRPAVLAELSSRGCRLISPRAMDPDTKLTLFLPKELTEGKPLALKGWVLRCDAKVDGLPDGDFSIAVAFETLARNTEKSLRAVLKARAKGPDTLDEGEAHRVAAVFPEADRRSNGRGEFRGQVLAIRDAAERTLVGRNLSTGGMLVEPDETLALGETLRLAVFGKAREEPILVEARVVRDDGSGGLALRFDGVLPDQARRLETLVATLPAVERLSDSEAAAMGTVVAEILRHEPASESCEDAPTDDDPAL